MNTQPADPLPEPTPDRAVREGTVTIPAWIAEEARKSFLYEIAEDEAESEETWISAIEILEAAITATERPADDTVTIPKAASEQEPTDD